MKWNLSQLHYFSTCSTGLAIVISDFVARSGWVVLCSECKRAFHEAISQCRLVYLLFSLSTEEEKQTNMIFQLTISKKKYEELSLLSFYNLLKVSVGNSLRIMCSFIIHHSR